MFGAVAVGDGENLVEGGVTVFGLDEAVGPARQHGSVAGEVAVLVDDVVHLRAVEDEVVDAVAGDGIEGELEGEAVVDVGVGGGVPNDSVALGGEEKGDGHVGVVLGDFDGGAAIVEHAALVLAEAVEGFGGVGPETVDDVEGGVAVEGDGRVGAGDAVAFAEKGLVVGSREGEVAAGE